jgi:putative ABC transport system permease protein
MIKNYFKIAWRNLIKNKGYSAINVGGLAVGMGVAILIGLWIYDELSFNKYHQNYNRIAQVMQNQIVNEGVIETDNYIPFPLDKELKNSYGDNFKYLVMASFERDHILAFKDKSITKSGMYMDTDAARLLSLKMLAGTADGLIETNSILLSASLAKTLFGNTDPLNKILKIDYKQAVKVTGVYEDLPFNTDLKNLSFIAPWELFVASNEWVQSSRDNNLWDNNSFQLFAQIADNVDFESVNKKIIHSKLDKVDAETKRFNAEIFLQPMSKWHLYAAFKNGINTGGAIQFVWLFAFIGVFVLLLACINFMNLSTARSEKRAKEIGIRKAVGSVRLQLVYQFLSESLLVVVFAFIMALLLVQFSLPWFNEVANKKMVVLWFNPLFWLAGIGFTLFTGLIAGSYPAIYLSSFQPLKVLKGTFRAGRFATIPRRILVVVQFTVSVILIIGTIVVFRQIQFAKNRPVGYTRDGLVMIEMITEDIKTHFDAFKNDVKNSGAVMEVAKSVSTVTNIESTSSGFEWKGKDPNSVVDFAIAGVSTDYGKTVGWQFRQGRDFSKEFTTDSASFVVNEAAVKYMGLKNPIDETVKWGGKDFKIIGVIKDMVIGSPYQQIKPFIFNIISYQDAYVMLKLNPEKSTTASLSKVQAIFKKYATSAPFEYRFADDEYAKKFGNEERIGKLAFVFAILAIFISCLGIFGLAAFTAAQRTKEIGIRKVVGASVFNLWQLLSKDFVLLVFISFLIATPVAYYFMHNWLQHYEYRTSISWWIFAVVCIGTLLITLLTVSFQSIKAALMNPVKSLKTE